MSTTRLRAAVVGLALVAGCGSASEEAPPDGPVTGWSAAPGQVARAESAVTAEHGDPVELRIPALKIENRLVRLGLLADGTLKPPDDPARAGWHRGGVQPGDPGPAVIAGHVDSKTGPAVFTRLGELQPGAEIVVEDKAGEVARFTVDQVTTYPKDRFPTAAVYGPTPDAQLRLITCGGDFDRVRGHYADNVVVYASTKRGD